MDLNWNELNNQGLFPGPGESQEKWEKRAAFCLQFKKKLAETPDYSNIQETDHGVVLLYEISPNWVPVLYSNAGLAPWHGACTWIVNLTEDSPTAAFLQLRASLQKKSHYLWIYKKSELMEHELVHAARMLYDEPRFEEILAYRTSSSRLRKWVGPIVQSAWESTLFLILAVLAAFVPLFGFPIYLSALPFLLILLGASRLAWRQRLYEKCLNHLRELGLREAFMLRLTDEEIVRFSKGSPKTILAYWQEEAKHTFRGRYFYRTYFEREIK